MPIKKQIKEFWEQSAAFYDMQLNHKISSQKEKLLWLQVLKKYCPSSQEIKVLDIGCGTGFLSLLLGEMGIQTTGLDLSSAMLEKAKENANHNNLSINFVEGDAEIPPFADNSFDIIVVRHLLWTLQNPNQAVQKWFQVLKPGGSVLIFDWQWQCKTLTGRMKRKIGHFIQKIKRNDFDKLHSRPYTLARKKMPFYGGPTKEQVKSLLVENHYTDIWHDDLKELAEYEKKILSLEYKIMYSKNNRFLVGGMKPKKI